MKLHNNILTLEMDGQLIVLASNEDDRPCFYTAYTNHPSFNTIYNLYTMGLLYQLGEFIRKDKTLPELKEHFINNKSNIFPSYMIEFDAKSSYKAIIEIDEKLYITSRWLTNDKVLFSYNKGLISYYTSKYKPILNNVEYLLNTENMLAISKALGDFNNQDYLQPVPMTGKFKLTIVSQDNRLISVEIKEVDDAKVKEVDDDFCGFHVKVVSIEPVEKYRPNRLLPYGFTTLSKKILEHINLPVPDGECYVYSDKGYSYAILGNEDYWVPRKSSIESLIEEFSNMGLRVTVFV